MKPLYEAHLEVKERAMWELLRTGSSLDHLQFRRYERPKPEELFDRVRKVGFRFKEEYETGPDSYGIKFIAEPFSENQTSIGGG